MNRCKTRPTCDLEVALFVRPVTASLLESGLKAVIWGGRVTKAERRALVALHDGLRGPVGDELP